MTYLSDSSILVFSGLDKGFLKCRHLVLQFLDFGPDASKLLVGSVKLAVGLSKGSTLRGDNLQK